MEVQLRWSGDGVEMGLAQRREDREGPSFADPRNAACTLPRFWRNCSILLDTKQIVKEGISSEISKALLMVFRDIKNSIWPGRVHTTCLWRRSARILLPSMCRSVRPSLHRLQALDVDVDRQE